MPEGPRVGNAVSYRIQRRNLARLWTGNGGSHDDRTDRRDGLRLGRPQAARRQGVEGPPDQVVNSAAQHVADVHEVRQPFGVHSALSDGGYPLNRHPDTCGEVGLGEAGCAPMRGGLWVPEVGGPIDPDNEAHDLVMSVFGGMSKGERNRIKVRVRTSMASQTQVEGRFLGGRPPYGYTLANLGPHPNPAKAADGRQLRGLVPDPNTAPVVQRIYTEFLAGNGLYVIAEGLTADGILCPSAYDRARNPHRRGTAWSKSAIRVILTNPRYTGRQVWNKQRTDEVLLDVDDVALGHTTIMRWNPKEKWVISKDIVHTPLIDADTFDQVQQVLQRRGDGPGFEHKQHRSRHIYVFKGRVYCGLCHRKMQGQRSNGEAYYRCRYPEEYALANKIVHPRNVYLRERDIVGPLDDALAAAFRPGRIDRTVAMMAAAQAPEPVESEATRQARVQVANWDAKLTTYRAALEAGADPEVVTGWIKEAQTERAKAARVLNAPPPSRAPQMTPAQITELVAQLGDIGVVLGEADPADRAAVYQQLGVRLTYHPDTQKVRVQAQPVADSHGDLVCVRGGTIPLNCGIPYTFGQVVNECA
nr:recombinase family protein [Actinoplanes campanulatus]